MKTKVCAELMSMRLHQFFLFPSFFLSLAVVTQTDESAVRPSSSSAAPETTGLSGAVRAWQPRDSVQSELQSEGLYEVQHKETKWNGWGENKTNEEKVWGKLPNMTTKSFWCLNCRSVKVLEIGFKILVYPGSFTPSSPTGGEPGIKRYQSPDMRGNQGPGMMRSHEPNMRSLQGPDIRRSQILDMRRYQGPGMRRYQGLSNPLTVFVSCKSLHSDSTIYFPYISLNIWSFLELGYHFLITLWNLDHLMSCWHV